MRSGKRGCSMNRSQLFELASKLNRDELRTELIRYFSEEGKAELAKSHHSGSVEAIVDLILRGELIEPS